MQTRFPANLLVAPVLCAALVAIVGGTVACETAPSSLPAAPQRNHDIALSPGTTEVRGVVPPRATLAAMLQAQGLAVDAVQRLIDAARPVFDPRRLRTDQPFALIRTIEGAVRHFEYEIDADTFLRVSAAALGEETLRAEVLPIPKTLAHAVATGSINDEAPSLFQAMSAAGERPELAVAMAEVFAGEIDFNTELQPNDQFQVAFERFQRDGRPDSYGAITAAEFVNEGRVLRAFRFTPPGSKPDYFDEQGRSLRRFFLKSPLKFDPRVTSRFSTSRMHPVLRTARAHNGVDYAAASGAPIVAIAAGTVLGATSDNANGRMVRLRHSNGYVTYYLHMSRFAAGMRAGARVSQGQTIGYVGSTGLATGPHLHYGLQKNGRWVDPIREHRNLPPGDPIPAASMAAFRTVKEEALSRLDATRNHPRTAPVVTAAR